MISPLDAAVAARSFPRRWRAALATVGDEEDAAELLARTGALDRAADSAALLGSAADRLPVHHRSGAAAGGDVLERLATNATRLAEAIEAVDTEAWARGDHLQTVSSAIEETAALLRRAERDLRDAVARRH